jgi:hypothetical protein
MNLKLGLILAPTLATIISNFIFFVGTGSYNVGSSIAKIEAKLESLNNDLKTREEFTNYRIDHLKQEIGSMKIKGGQKQ